MLCEQFAANAQLLRRLEGDLSCGRLPHAVLLTGEAGSGKTRLAGLLAEGLVCSAQDKPCGTCRDCKKAQAGAHPDIRIYGSRQRLASFKKEDIERLREELYLSPSEAEHQVFILDDVRDLTLSASNSLLKALEEPPENTYLILTADSRRELLPTVLSRVVEFPLALPSPAEAAPFVSGLAQTDLQTALQAAERFAGNIGRAAAFLSAPEERETAALIDRILDSQKKRDVFSLTQILLSLGKSERKKIIELLGRLYEQYCRIAAAKTGSTRFGVGADGDGIPLSGLLNCCDAVRKAEDYLTANAPASTVLVWLAAELKL